MSQVLMIGGLMTVAVLRLLGAPTVDGDPVTIINSGSTNRPGFRIVVDRSGAAELTSAPRRPSQLETAPIQRMLPHALVETFYADLAAAKPLDSLPAVRCAKSASFGSTLIVRFGEKQTPDLSCGDDGNAVIRDLIRDISQIVALIEAT